MFDRPPDVIVELAAEHEIAQQCLWAIIRSGRLPPFAWRSHGRPKYYVFKKKVMSWSPKDRKPYDDGRTIQGLTEGPAKKSEPNLADGSAMRLSGNARGHSWTR